MQWAIQMAIEAEPNLAATSLDATNTATCEIERECPEAAIRANLYLHRLLPMFEMLYKRGRENCGITMR
jgi:hypothetical protein